MTRRQLGTMEPTVKFTVTAEAGSSRSEGGLLSLSGRIVMRVEDEEIDLGIRTLDLTMTELLERSPLMPVDAAADIFSDWLFADHAEAATAYYDALEAAQYSAPISWAFRTPTPAGVLDLAVEAMPGHRFVTPAVYREVAAPSRGRQTSISRYQPLVGCWRLQPVSLIPRRLLPGARDATVEYDAILGRGLPTWNPANLEYAVTLDSLRQLIAHLREDNIHVLHLIMRDYGENGILLQDGELTADELAAWLAAAGWSELQLIVLSGPGPSDGGRDMAWALMDALPVPATVSYHGQPAFRSCIVPFTERFYGCLGAGYDVVEAAARARAGMRDGGRATTPDLLSPVVHVRADIDPPRIVAGDPGIEGILAAAEAVAFARETVEAPEVWELAETVPMTLAQIHSRLVGIADAHLQRLRTARQMEERLLHDDVQRRPPAYTVSAAVAEQLDAVLNMLPAPAGGADGLLPVGPPGLYWGAILRRNRTVVQRMAHQPRSGPTKLAHSPPQTPWVYLHRHDRHDPLEVAILRRGTADIDAPPASEASRVVFDVRHWPPSVAAQRVVGADDIEYMNLLERELASGAAQTIRALLRFHFRQLLDRDGSLAHLPRGITPARIVRGALEAAGIAVTNVEPEVASDTTWPAGCHLVEDVDTGRRCLLLVRNDPDIDMTRTPRWQHVCDYWDYALTREREPCIMHIDTWGIDAVTSWRPQHALAEDNGPSWVWDQLTQAATEYRHGLLHRLWEWWIGCALAENGDG